MNVKDIQDLRAYLVDTYHANRVREQEIDEKYRKDTFDVPFIQDEYWIVRTGKGGRMVDAPAEHILTSNPQVFREPHRKGATEAQEKVGKELNRWANKLLWQSPQPYKQFVKHLLGPGESWIYVIHNEMFNRDDPNSMPIKFILHYPTIVFVDPIGGEDDGVPGRILLYYLRTADNIKRAYPWWTWKERRSRDWSDKIPFLMYYDKDIRYLEADKEGLLTDKAGNLSNGDGIQENIYGFVPFMHAYSGFGSGSADGDPSELAVGRLRNVRDLLGEQCAIRSTMNTLIHKFAHKPVDLIYPGEGPAPTGDIGKNYDRGLNAFNTIGLPQGASFRESEIDQLPSQELFQHLYNIEGQIDKEDPLGLTGQALGTSGRQQGMAEEGALRRYATVVENTAHSFAKAFGMGLRICEKIPNMMPKGLSKSDIGGFYGCEVELKATDPLEQDRLRNLGEKLWNMGQGSIDLETNLTMYQGYTQGEADKIIAKRLVDNATINSPVVAQILGMQAVREAGMEEQYQAIIQAQQQAGGQTGEPRNRPSEVETERGREEADVNLTQRPGRRQPTQ
ncbi:hypothetical protein LCGC14_0560880 [marine sediment metagenome]|uniref:Portal protein n=1 Tax=marine sediment metagenome TaxID=412755 RepID=A0A0F9S5M3_9ZZZZ